MNDHLARLAAERELIRLYEQWPARRNTNGPSRPRAFLAWLRVNHPHLIEYGVLGQSDPYQHINAIIARWESTYGRVERIGSK